MTGPILILSEHPVIAALVGMLIELRGFAPVFAAAGEEPTEAVKRLRPIIVVLIDAELDAARSDVFFATAAKRGIGVAVFGPNKRAREVAEVAESRQIPWFTLPPTVEQLFDAVAAARGKRSERRANTAGPSEAIPAGEDASILRDSAGRRWIVYDRRASQDRRQATRQASADRVFVGEDGQTVHCVVEERDLESRSARDLEAQLNRAIR